MNSTADVLGSLLEASIVSLTSLPGGERENYIFGEGNFEFCWQREVRIT